MGLIRLAAASAVGYALYRYANRHSGDFDSAAYAPGESKSTGFTNVRNAGPDAMRSDPPQWDKVDEASDESFPASDPGTRY